MRTRLHRRHWIFRAAAAFAAAGAAISAAVLLYRMPELQNYAVRAGLFSAGLVMPEGGLSLLPGQAEPVSESSSAPSESAAILPPEAVRTDPFLHTAKQQDAFRQETVPEPEPKPEPSVPEPSVPEENRAQLVHKTYAVSPSNIFLPLKHGYVKNCTGHSAKEIYSQAEHPPYFSIEDTDAPQVLIMHTHTTESFVPFTGAYYDKTMSFRSTDNNQNISQAGKNIAAQLNAAGITAIQDVTQHDYPSYNGSYDRSRKTVERYLKQYPSIKIVLDIHRDAIAWKDQVYSAETEINGREAAQLMIISGCDDGTMNYPDYLKNLSFAAALQNQLESDWPTLTRPILFDYRKYNQDLTTGSLLIEVGSHGNTLEQVKYTGELIGKSLAVLLNRMKEKN